jgi:CheY-like chemotaxis protein
LALPKVLVVDDDSALRAMVSDALREDGFAVETAANGALALGMVGNVRPALIILDLNMPIMDGVTFAQTYQSLTGPPAPIILLSAAATDEVARRIGAVAHLAKPVDLDALIELAWRLVRNRRGPESGRAKRARGADRRPARSKRTPATD